MCVCVCERERESAGNDRRKSRQRRSFQEVRETKMNSRVGVPGTEMVCPAPCQSSVIDTVAIRVSNLHFQSLFVVIVSDQSVCLFFCSDGV